MVLQVEPSLLIYSSHGSRALLDSLTVDK